METFVVRVWVPDRPGALGQVASRIGAVRGDVVGIDILERGAGRAIDELVVELPDASLVSLLLAEIDQVDGVDVEDVRPAPAELVAFVAGSQSSAAVSSGECGPDDVAWSPLGTTRLALLLGRQGRPFRS